MLPPRNPLTLGKSSTWSIYVPDALVKEIERQAAIDGYEKTSPYVVELLLHAIHARKLEREAEQKAKHP